MKCLKELSYQDPMDNNVNRKKCLVNQDCDENFICTNSFCQCSFGFTL